MGHYTAGGLASQSLRSRGPPRAPTSFDAAFGSLVAGVVIVGAGLGVGLILPSPPGPCGSPGSSSPATNSPIKHVFFLIKENHAFENYFGSLPGVLGYPPNGSFPVQYGSNATISPFPLNASTTPDLPHDAASSTAAVDGGRMDHFVAQAAADGYTDPSAAVGYYTKAQLPQYFEYAENSTLADRFFSGILGPTLPNRLFDLAATSGNWTTDQPPPPSSMEFPTILQQLSRAGISWNYDYSGTESNLTPLYLPTVTRDACAVSRVQPVQDLPAQLGSSTAPSVVYLGPSHDPLYSEHPPANVSLGAEWTASVVNTIFTSPVANSSVVFLFYDEFGGFWDPIPPPSIDALGDGVRIPLLVLSPWTPPHHTVSESLDPGSLLRFVDDNFGLPPLNARVAGSPPLDGFFDFGAAPRSPVILSTPLHFRDVARGFPIILSTAAPIVSNSIGLGPNPSSTTAPVLSFTLAVRIPSAPAANRPCDGRITTPLSDRPSSADRPIRSPAPRGRANQ